MKEHNPMCDGTVARQCSADPEVRVLPITPGGSNAILCHAHYLYEIGWRRERNRDLGPTSKFDLPAWDYLKVYGGAK